jgi:hypothetical protein
MTDFVYDIPDPAARGARFHEGTIQTYTGKAYDFADPDPDSICLEDIAHALSNACRFAGHTKRFYSVAEHCVRVSRIMEERSSGSPFWALYGLLHDAHEAYVWDCPRPFKPLLGDAFEQFAAKADAAIALRFGLNPEGFHAAPIKQADDCALVAEARILMHHGPEEWEQWETHYKFVPAPPVPWIEESVGWAPRDAEEEFLSRAAEVGLS